MWQIVTIIAVVMVVFKVLTALRLAKAEDVQAVLLGGKYRIIDVRTVREFKNGHLKNAKNIPVQELGAKIEKAVPKKTMPLLIYCHSGSRAVHAEKILRAKGYEKVYNLGSYHRAESIINSI